LGRHKEMVETSKRIAQAYRQLGQLSSATLEYESILQLFPQDPDVRRALDELEHRTTCLAVSTPATAIAAPEKNRATPPRPGGSGQRASAEIDDGRKAMHKLFVEGKYISATDFNQLWPSADGGAGKVREPFLQILADQGVMPLETSLKLVCEKTRLCFLPLEKYDVDVELARSFPREVCRRWCILPFDRMSKSVLVATANPFNQQAARDLAGAAHQRLLWYLASPPELVKALGKTFR
ncbi:MAG: hypothetical protein M1608_18460, partial [Candidatus Omnitrophica bacterium]|nr:hypothetical protein [Candidatus Omnitrophota bacterium]